MTTQKRIEQIVTAARRRRLEIREIREHLGDNGKWYGLFGVPFGVRLTGESRICGYAFVASNGTTVGKRFPTREAAEQWQIAKEQNDAQAFRDALSGMTSQEIDSQEAYWKTQNPSAFKG